MVRKGKLYNDYHLKICKDKLTIKRQNFWISKCYTIIWQGGSGQGNFTCEIGDPVPNGRGLILGGGSFTLHKGTSQTKG